MTQPTDEQIMALWRELPSETQEGREPDDIRPWVAAVLALAVPTAYGQGRDDEAAGADHRYPGAGNYGPGQPRPRPQACGDQLAPGLPGCTLPPHTVGQHMATSTTGARLTWTETA